MKQHKKRWPKQTKSAWTKPKVTRNNMEPSRGFLKSKLELSRKPVLKALSPPKNKAKHTFVKLYVNKSIVYSLFKQQDIFSQMLLHSPKNGPNTRPVNYENNVKFPVMSGKGQLLSSARMFLVVFYILAQIYRKKIYIWSKSYAVVFAYFSVPFSRSI